MASDTTPAAPDAAPDQPPGDAQPAAAARDAPAGDGKRGNAEAAKYRRRLRDVEAERDRLAGALKAAAPRGGAPGG